MGNGQWLGQVKYLRCAILGHCHKTSYLQTQKLRKLTFSLPSHSLGLIELHVLYNIRHACATRPMEASLPRNGTSQEQKHHQPARLLAEPQPQIHAILFHRES